MDDDFPSKNRKRAKRRKRNFVAKELRENKEFAPKVIPNKKKRHKIRVKDILDEVAEDSEGGWPQDQDQVGQV